MELSTLLLVFACIAFFALFVIFMVLYIKRSSESIKPENAPKILSNYAVIPNVVASGLKLQTTCSGSGTADGQIGTQNCNFNGIEDLFQAVNICNQYTFTETQSYATCTGFIYNSGNKTVNFINTQYPINSSKKDNITNGNVYLKQI
jgi:hypothetical protein